MELNTGKEVFSEVLQVEEKNRPWAREVIYITICIAICMTTFFVFKSQRDSFAQRAIKAEAKVDALQLIMINEGKECPKLIREAERNKDIYYAAKIDNLQNKYEKQLKEDHVETMSKFNYLNRETKRVMERAEQLNKKIRQ